MYPHDQSQMGGYGSSHADSYSGGFMGGCGSSCTGSYSEGSMGGYNQAQMSGYNQGRMGGYNHGPMGGYGQNPMGSHQQSDSDSYHPSYTSSQLIGASDSSVTNFPSLKPINTRGRQSARTHEDFDGSHSTTSLNRALQNLDLQEQPAVPKTARLTRTRFSANPRRPSKRQVE